ncbi:hypothetical protein [Microcoleus sp.]|uniref:hypothetical protein n=1 Tax=Microcoleus sp. TaxID=44472 RepID=UPI003523B6D0
MFHLLSAKIQFPQSQIDRPARSPNNKIFPTTVKLILLFMAIALFFQITKRPIAFPMLNPTARSPLFSESAIAL